MDLALDTLKELSTTIRDSFGLYLNKTASDLIAGITGGIYSSISIDENLNAFLNTRRKLIPLEQVSSGTADQIYLALRLAAAHFIQGDADRLPLISPCSPAAIRFTSSKKRLRPIRRNASPPPIPAHDTHTRQIPSNFIHI